MSKRPETKAPRGQAEGGGKVENPTRSSAEYTPTLEDLDVLLDDAETAICLRDRRLVMLAEVWGRDFDEEKAR